MPLYEMEVVDTVLVRRLARVRAVSEKHAMTKAMNVDPNDIDDEYLHESFVSRVIHTQPRLIRPVAEGVNRAKVSRG